MMTTTKILVTLLLACGFSTQPVFAQSENADLERRGHCEHGILGHAVGHSAERVGAGFGCAESEGDGGGLRAVFHRVADNVGRVAHRGQRIGPAGKQAAHAQVGEGLECVRGLVGHQQSLGAKAGGEAAFAALKPGTPAMHAVLVHAAEVSFKSVAVIPVALFFIFGAVRLIERKREG